MEIKKKKKKFIVDLNSGNEWKEKKKKKKRHTNVEWCGGTTKAPLGQGRRDDKGKITVALNWSPELFHCRTFFSSLLFLLGFGLLGV